MMERTIDGYSGYVKSLVKAAVGDAWNGSKFDGSFGPLDDYEYVDYWTLRKRSLRLFRENIYAKGIIRRLVWNVVHTGIVVQPVPDAAMLWPYSDTEEREERAVEFGEKISRIFNLYANDKDAFSADGGKSFGEFQEQVFFESLACGDGIIIKRINKKTNLPCWQWVNGDHIRTPYEYDPPKGHFIRHGVEFNSKGERVAFHVMSEINGEFFFERVPCFGEKSGEVLAWMVYGSETLLDDTRGEPFLADTLYMLKDLDRYRDAEARAAVVNAMLAFFIKRNVTTTNMSRPTDGLMSRLRPNGGEILPKGYMEEGSRPEIKVEEPGTVYENLEPGEDLISPNPNRPNVNYAAFESAIISALAWTHGIPPEILMLKFGNNYSASRQANNEFEVYLTRQTRKLADAFCQRIYEDFISRAVYTENLNLPGFIQAVYEKDWKRVSAWKSAAWIGLNRPSVDREKEVRASYLALDVGLTTFDLESRRISGLTFAQVMQTQKRERELMKKLGFVPHTDEDNNGKPAYGNGGSEDEDESGDEGSDSSEM